MEQAEEARAEAEAESLRVLGLVHERRVVQPQLLERVAQRRVLLAEHREEAREHHRLRRPIPGERLARRIRGEGERVAHATVGHGLQSGRDVADLTGRQPLDRHRVRREDAELQELGLLLRRHEQDPIAPLHGAVDDADMRDDALVRVVVRVEDQGAERRVGIAARRRHAVDDRIEDLLHTLPGLPGREEDLFVLEPEGRAEILADEIDVDIRQVDLVDDRDHLEALLDRKVRVREGLGLDAL